MVLVDAAAIVAAIEERGASIRVRDGRLGVRPGHVLDEDLRDEIRANRADLIALLSTGGGDLLYPPENHCNAGPVPPAGVEAHASSGPDPQTKALTPPELRALGVGEIVVCRWCTRSRRRPADLPPYEPTLDCGIPECRVRSARYRHELGRAGPAAVLLLPDSPPRSASGPDAVDETHPDQISALVQLEQRGLRVELGDNGYDLRPTPPAMRMPGDMFDLLVERQDQIRWALQERVAASPRGPVA
jgi:hypothetical protein